MNESPSSPGELPATDAVPATPASATERRVVTRPVTTVFLAVTGTLLAWLAYQIIEPFLVPIAWATILAVIFGPLYDRVCRVFRHPGVGALITTILTLLIVLAPLVLVGLALAAELRQEYRQLAPAAWNDRNLIETINQSPVLGPLWRVAEDLLRRQDIDIGALAASVAQRVSGFVVSAITRTVANLTTFSINVVLTAFTLYYFFRDGRSILRRLQLTMPVRAETIERVYHDVAALIRATINGAVVINLIKGLLAGLAFQILGLPSPALWGTVGAILSVIPVVGISLVWVPAAVILLLQGHPGKAVLLTIWGLTVLSLIDNFLYPLLVRSQIRLHTLLIFFSTLGGLSVFGLLGFVLGPVIAALTLTLIRVMGEYYGVSERTQTTVPTARN
ncbi:MAG: AI-2E family transporter [Blastocatellia bacterium]